MNLDNLQWPSQASDLSPIEQPFLITEDKTEGTDPQTKQQLKVTAVTAWPSISSDETKHPMIFMGSSLSAVIDFSSKY